ncbi:response regulator transcription factor [Streptomyces californicus]
MFTAAPGFEVLGEAANGWSALLAVVERCDPDVVLMDLRMPGGGGVAAIAELTRRGARSRVLATTYHTDSDTLPAIEAGATGYLLEDAPRDELFAAVRAAADGRSVLSPAVASRLMTRVRTPAADPAGTALSAREREVLVLVARGTTNREIAAELFISEATVKTHLTHVFAKLGRQGPARRRRRLRPRHPGLRDA